MTKKTRGATPRPTRRPGTRPPTSRPAQTRLPAAISRPLDPETAELVPELALEPRSAAAMTDAPASIRSAHLRTRAKPGSLLAARAATEYVYVAQDLRKIAIVASALFGVLVVLWIVLVVLGVSALY
ncbi:MAG: hypothetical protein ABIZ34_06955 [Candidatus Limnocylindrales bacterium]